MSVKIQIMTLSLLIIANTILCASVNYVKSHTSKVTLPCCDEQRPCLTLNQYASYSDVYFINNSIFYFCPGMHRLDESLLLENLYKFSFQGLSNGVDIEVDSSATITWNASMNIKISSIRFILHDNFTSIMRFKHSQFVQLSNISIYGNGSNGCSAIIGQGATLNIKNSTFIGINGFLGAAIMTVASNITFAGSNSFANNTAVIGGCIYMSDSSLILNGNSQFLNNKCTSVKYYYNSKDLATREMSLCNNYSNSEEVFIWGCCGGALFMDNGNLTIQGNASFTLNTADGEGGAMQLNYTNSNIRIWPFSVELCFLMGHLS